jgi:hypothetical protein
MTAPWITGTLEYNYVWGFEGFTLGFLMFSILPPRSDTERILRTISLGIVVSLALEGFCTINPTSRLQFLLA